VGRKSTGALEFGTEIQKNQEEKKLSFLTKDLERGPSADSLNYSYDE
jgi:hypothetical protein